MKPIRWLKDEVDERLEGLFSDEPDDVRGTIRELVDQAQTDPEIEELLADTLQSALDQGNDDTMGSAWIGLILGEIGSEEGIAPLLGSISSDDEVLAANAIRALQRIGRPALEAILDRMEEDEEIDAAAFAAGAEVLEGVRLHDLPDLSQRIEDVFLEHLQHIRQILTPDITLSGHALRRLETASLTLARLGVAAAHDDIKHFAEEHCDGMNSFLQEALEILEEQPAGIPPRDSSWETEFRYALGEHFAADEPEDSPSGLKVSTEQTADERIVRIRREGE